MQGIDVIRTTHGNELADKIAKQQGGFMTLEQVKTLAEHDNTRFVKCLVRCGCGRFTVSAQDCQHFVTIIDEHDDLKKENSGDNGDYVRDISLLA